jgi:hypothetical protein
MRRTKRRSPQLEGLESRSLLSTVHAAAAQVLPLGNVLNGTTTGSYVTVAANRLGNAVAINAAGSLGVLGAFHAIGVVGGVGGSYGEAGQIVLYNAHGTIVLQVAGQPSTGPLNYTIVRGTGAFLHATGAGQVVLQGLSAAHARGMVSVVIEPKPDPPPPNTSADPTGITVTVEIEPVVGQSSTVVVANAPVQIESPVDGATIAKGTTDANGNVSFTNLAPGRYLVVAMARDMYPMGAVPVPQYVIVTANTMSSVTLLGVPYPSSIITLG